MFWPIIEYVRRSRGDDNSRAMLGPDARPSQRKGRADLAARENGAIPLLRDSEVSEAWERAVRKGCEHNRISTFEG